MRSRHILYPPHPHRIVDMAEFVDVSGGGDEGESEWHWVVIGNKLSLVNHW
jgi:hypothetical protein